MTVFVLKKGHPDQNCDHHDHSCEQQADCFCAAKRPFLCSNLTKLVKHDQFCAIRAKPLSANGKMRLSTGIVTVFVLVPAKRSVWAVGPRFLTVFVRQPPAASPSAARDKHDHRD